MSGVVGGTSVPTLFDRGGNERVGTEAPPTNASGRQQRRIRLRLRLHQPLHQLG
ncbi:DUF6053 domain-containing protein [Lysobacter enzymogenes]|uniref:DUF6053 domain-containing protein n=1 Tax=Lysobacter enzymogenes TaxID=69 RepID=UPI003CCD220C